MTKYKKEYYWRWMQWLETWMHQNYFWNGPKTNMGPGNYNTV